MVSAAHGDPVTGVVGRRKKGESLYMIPMVVGEQDGGGNFLSLRHEVIAQLPDAGSSVKNDKGPAGKAEGNA